MSNADGCVLLDGTELAPGRYRLHVADDINGSGAMLTVPVPALDELLEMFGWRLLTRVAE